MVTTKNQILDVPAFIYLSAMMKSSSTLMWLVLDAIRNPDNRADPTTLEAVPADEFRPLTVEFLQHFPRGGVFKNHAPYEHHTDRFLKQTGCKYVILMRHPADHLAGLYCHMRGLSKEELKIPPDRDTGWWFTAGPLPSDFLDGDHHSAMRQMIEGGYLWKILEWMADWIRFRHPGQSRLLRYEDVIVSFDAVVTDLCIFIRNEAPDDDLLHYLGHVFEQETRSGWSKGSLDKYPLGWTGKVGIYQDYLSPSNIDLYNDQVRTFLACYPHASPLLELYPNLLVQSPVVGLEPGAS
jgi:Sulfotransferase domain